MNTEQKCEHCEKTGNHFCHVLANELREDPLFRSAHTEQNFCTCASFFTVRGVHKKDCPAYTEQKCHCKCHRDSGTVPDHKERDCPSCHTEQKGWREEFEQTSPHAFHGREWALAFIERTLTEQREQMVQNIAMLRQWLNEDRIQDAKKMVTNEDLKHWLIKDTPPLKAKDKI